MQTRLPLMFLTCLLLGAPAAAAPDSVKETIAAKLKTVMPNLRVTSVKDSPIKGVYEVEVDDANILYMSADGRYALLGDLRDLDEKRNLTEETRGQKRLQALKAIPPKETVEFAPASTKHVIHVFTDVDCTYCRKLHKEVDILNKSGVAVRYLAFPRAGLGSESFNKTVSVWCAKDRKTALTDAKNGKNIPTATCDNPVKQQYELGLAMGVKGTPTIILENGRELGGYVPADKMVQLIEKGGEE